MSSRQAKWAKQHALAGLCNRCSLKAWKDGRCFRCAMRAQFSKRRIISYIERNPAAFNIFVNGMAARYERILHDEGFAVDAIKEPAEIIKKAGFTWAKGTPRKKLLEIINRLDDLAIRKRFGGGDADE